MLFVFVVSHHTRRLHVLHLEIRIMSMSRVWYCCCAVKWSGARAEILRVPQSSANCQSLLSAGAEWGSDEWSVRVMGRPSANGGCNVALAPCRRTPVLLKTTMHMHASVYAKHTWRRYGEGSPNYSQILTYTPCFSNILILALRSDTPAYYWQQTIYNIYKI